MSAAGSSSGPTLTHDEFLGLRRFGSLDGLRAIAITLVFTAHIGHQQLWPHLHGASGVTLFFVLSGFLITTLLLREEDRSGRVGFGSFYVRRAFRIYPMFLGVLALYCVLILGLGLEADRRDLFVDAIPEILLFFPEHMVFFHPDGQPYPPYDGAWSIGIEEKFYFVWPVLAFALLAGARARLRLPVLVVLGGLSLAASFHDPLMYLAPYQFLAYGAVVAVLLHHPAGFRVAAACGRSVVLLPVLVALLALQVGSDQIDAYGDLYWLYGLLVAPLVAGLVVTRSRGVGWLSSRPMVHLAAVSYVFYLLHNFVLNGVESALPTGGGLPGSVLSSALAFALAVVGSTVVHRTFEEPLRRVGVRISRRLERRAADRTAQRLDPLAP